MEFVSLIVFGVMIVIWIVMPEPNAEPARVASDESRSPSLASPIYET